MLIVQGEKKEDVFELFLSQSSGEHSSIKLFSKTEGNSHKTIMKITPGGIVLSKGCQGFGIDTHEDGTVIVM